MAVKLVFLIFQSIKSQFETILREDKLRRYILTTMIATKHTISHQSLNA